MEVFDAFSKGSTTPIDARFLSWQPPDIQAVRLNTDGASQGNPVISGAGVLGMVIWLQRCYLSGMNDSLLGPCRVSIHSFLLVIL